MTVQEKVLVTYGTRYGATAGVARLIGDTLVEGYGVPVDVTPVEEVKDLTPYTAVILGSPVYMGKWRPAVRNFLKAHRETLAHLPVAYFGVGSLPQTGPTPDVAITKVREEVPEVVPIDTAMFSGALNKRKMVFWHRTLMSLMRAPEGDFRDPVAIKEWANHLAGALNLTAREAVPV